MFSALLLFVLFSCSNANFIVEEECLNYTVYPIQYELTIIPYIYKDNSYYHGDITITVIANANVREIELDAKDLDIRSGSIKVLDGSTDLVNGARPYEYDKTNGKLFIHLREPLKMYSQNNRQFYYIKMSFNKYIKEDSAGLFLVNYYEDDVKNAKSLYATRLSPNKAKFMFPCFDNPRFEAVFKFKVYILSDHPGMQYTNSSLVIAEEMKRVSSKDYTIIEYIPSPQVALHQVGFHYSQFTNKSVKGKNNDTLVIWAPGDKLYCYDYIQRFGISMIDLMHQYEGTKRPITAGSINLVAVPTNLQGYEIGSWNLLTNGANRIANLVYITSIQQIEVMRFELAQQLCRIWLGNPGEENRTRWKEEWLKEGMATYYASYFLAQKTSERYPKRLQPLGIYGLSMKHKAMEIDWPRSTPALEVFNDTLAIEIPARYKDLVTMKTGTLFWMLENWIGPEKFHNALIKYINSRRGKYISLQDFLTTLDHETVECSYQLFNGSTSSRILRSWFSQAGYPVINVRVLRDRTPNVVQLNQRRFSFTNEHHRELEYLIPISYTIQNSKNCFNCYRPRFVIGSQPYTFIENLDGGWIILNSNGSGYYRVNYDSDSWLLIAKTLVEDHQSIEEMTRSQIVNDVFALYVSGNLDMSIAMRVLAYLDKETSLAVWDSVISGYELLKLEGAACNMTKYIYWEWSDFMKQKIPTIYNGLIKNLDQQTDVRLLRNKVITFAAELEYEQCLTQLRRMYQETRRDPKRILDPDARRGCYYVLLNDTNSHLRFKKLSGIEEEDRNSVENRIRENNRFLIKIPYGEPRPLPIISSESPLSSTTPEPVPDKIVMPDASTSNLSSIIFVVASTLILRLF